MKTTVIYPKKNLAKSTTTTTSPPNDDDDDTDPETANSTRQTPFKMSTSKVKTSQLWNKSKDDLVKQLGELKAELGQLRIQKITSSGSKLNKIHDLRKSIARILTVVNLKQRQQLRLFYKNKKYLPLELRPKQTRAIRRRLSPEEKSKVLEKTKKRTTHFPQRKYAVKAA
ncbi:ribosomal L29 protein-domain-containing protein [Nemania serpens]|nr:ribosomal L29 protein-domain-containing protein [Nemania serpens]